MPKKFQVNESKWFLKWRKHLLSDMILNDFSIAKNKEKVRRTISGLADFYYLQEHIVAFLYIGIFVDCDNKRENGRCVFSSSWCLC